MVIKDRSVKLVVHEVVENQAALARVIGSSPQVEVTCANWVPALAPVRAGQVIW